MRSTLAALLMCALLAACGAGPDADAGTDADSDGELATLSSFPVTLEGELMLDVIEGDADFGAYSDFNFGDLKADGKVYLVHAAGPVAQSGGLAPEGGRARVTISGIHAEYGGFPTYEISRIETQ